MSDIIVLEKERQLKHLLDEREDLFARYIVKRTELKTLEIQLTNIDARLKELGK